MCMGVLLVCMSVNYIYAVSKMAEVGVESPEIGVIITVSHPVSAGN